MKAKRLYVWLSLIASTHLIFMATAGALVVEIRQPLPDVVWMVVYTSVTTALFVYLIFLYMDIFNKTR
jgi:hypothetical protein